MSTVDEDDARRAVFMDQLDRVRPVTRRLVEAIMLDVWPNHTAIVDFGINSQAHYEALYYPIREGEILPMALDAALGHGRELTKLTREAASNPHKGIEFHTSWDAIMGRDLSQNGTSSHRHPSPSEIVNQCKASANGEPGKTNDTGQSRDDGRDR